MNAHDPNPPCGGSISGDGARAALKARVPVITLITKSDMPPLMSKRISLDDDGKLKSDGSECRMVTGVAQRVCVETASILLASSKAAVLIRRLLLGQ